MAARSPLRAFPSDAVCSASMSGIPAGAGSLLGKRLGKYEILALLALGGTAEIYLARIGGAAGFEKYVVVKCLHDHLADDQEFVKMFLDEARLAAHLDHSNIVQTMELGEHENRYYMVMEFLAGLSLAMVVRRADERLSGGRVPVPIVLNMMAQACAGLHYAHERSINGRVLNIVHRDISPQNLVVSFEGVVKVVDFGIAKADLRETKTRTGTIKGKFAYMSPEQCIAANVDRRTDVFALGVIAHELLTGRRLFKRSSPYETYQTVIECQVEAPSRQNIELDPALDDVIMRAVAKDKEQRYPTAEAFGDALLGYLHHRGKGSGPGDVSRFFDASFNQEIEEHGARMRELISGRDFSVETGVKWDEAAEAREARRNQTVDLGRGKDDGCSDSSVSLSTRDLMLDGRPSSGSLSDVLGGLDGNNTDDDDELPADKTRIEANPLDGVQEMEAARTPVLVLREPLAAAQTSPTVALRPAAPRAIMPPSGPLPLPAPPSGPVVAIPSTAPRGPGFPNLSNLPTMIADPRPDDPAQAHTQLGGRLVDPDHGAPSGTVPAPVIPPQPLVEPPPGGYPVMTLEMSQNIARGADIFPSQPPQQSSGASNSSPPENGSQGGNDSGQHAASLMSPVGPQYPKQVNWAEAAAMPARAIPPWMLGLLFVGAIAAALILTIVIGKLAR